MTKAGHVIHLPQKRTGSESIPLPDAEFAKTASTVPDAEGEAAAQAGSTTNKPWDPSQGDRRNSATRPWANIPVDRRNASPASEESEDAKPDNDAVRNALKNILASAEFKSVPQLRAFLNYVVCAVLDDRVEEIKGYTIAVEALGRDPSFNPVTDPIVRVEAARLRRRLSDFYEGSGASEDLRITIPKGSYVPDISLREGLVNIPKKTEAVSVLAGDVPEESSATSDTACEEPANHSGQTIVRHAENRPGIEAFLHRHIVSIACLASFLLGFVIGRI